MILPSFRTQKYTVWKACERLGVRPPGVQDAFDSNDLITQASILGYSQIREMEDAEIENIRISASAGSKAF